MLEAHTDVVRAASSVHRAWSLLKRRRATVSHTIATDASAPTAVAIAFIVVEFEVTHSRIAVTISLQRTRGGLWKEMKVSSHRLFHGQSSTSQ